MADEALDLCSKLYRAHLHEAKQRDAYGRSTANRQRLERLERLWRRAADRWRRRRGFTARYNK